MAMPCSSKSRWIVRYAQEREDEVKKVQKMGVGQFLDKLREIGFSSHDMRDMMCSIIEPHMFLDSRRIVFRFTPEMVSDIVADESIPNIRSSAQSIGCSTFAVDLGGGTGFFFRTAHLARFAVSNSEIFGNDVRNDEEFPEELLPAYRDDDGYVMQFEWTPVFSPEKRKYVDDALASGKYMDAHEVAMDPEMRVLTRHVESIVSYLCCGRPDADGRTIHMLFETVRGRSSMLETAPCEMRMTWDEYMASNLVVVGA